MAQGAGSLGILSRRLQQGSCFEVGVGPDHETALQCYEQEFATRKIRGDSEPGGIGRLQELWLSPVQ